MKNLKHLNVELKNYLEETKGQLVADLVQLLKGENVNYLDGKAKTDIEALYFEYEYDYLDIMVWAVDKTGEIVTDTVILTKQRKNLVNESENWNSFLPEKIWKIASDFQEKHENDEDWDDLWEEYEGEKYEMFEFWFFDCWKAASAKTENRVNAYFSVHDTYFKTDLNTFKTINDDEIAERYTAKIKTIKY
jgi:hypothetical protein